MSQSHYSPGDGPAETIAHLVSAVCIAALIVLVIAALITLI